LTQGAGLGFVFVPLSTVAFATLPAELRTEGSGIFSLLRNIGRQLGISVVETMLDRNIQINHSDCAGNHAIQSDVAQQLKMPAALGPHSAGRVAKATVLRERRRTSPAPSVNPAMMTRPAIPSAASRASICHIDGR